MATNVIMPALGVAQQTGTLLKWLKTEGQSVSKGEPLMEIETDKATVEIEAAASGILAEITARAGDAIPVGEKIAVILAPGETLPTKQKATPVAHRQPPLSGPLPQGEGTGEGPPATTSTRMPTAAPANSPAPLGARVLASPKARRIAREQRIDLRTLRGTGPEGSVLADDVLRAAIGTSAASPDASVEAVQKIIPLTPMRRFVGERMTQCKLSAPHFYVSMEIDMSAVRGRRMEWRQRGDEVIPSINDFILLACARALKDFPSVNSTYTEQGIKSHSEINIGMAVALDEGLVVPVIRNADGLKLAELATRSRELIDKAQKKKLFPLDYEGGTFTVSNLGMLGVDSFIAIINPPQCAILAIGRVAPRVVVDEGMFAIKSVMTATLSADHRVVDGAIGARFLREVKELLESPEI
jgi:pyruvate dehydrogenase E2 component (dihydrolipoamide acetyltransferase)